MELSRFCFFCLLASTVSSMPLAPEHGEFDSSDYSIINTVTGGTTDNDYPMQGRNTYQYLLQKARMTRHRPHRKRHSISGQKRSRSMSWSEILSDPASQNVIKDVLDWVDSNGTGVVQNRFGRSLRHVIGGYRKPEGENSESSSRRHGVRYERAIFDSPTARKVLRRFLKHFIKGGRLQFRFG